MAEPRAQAADAFVSARDACSDTVSSSMTDQGPGADYNGTCRDHKHPSNLRSAVSSSGSSSFSHPTSSCGSMDATEPEIHLLLNKTKKRKHGRQIHYRTAWNGPPTMIWYQATDPDIDSMELLASASLSTSLVCCSDSETPVAAAQNGDGFFTSLNDSSTSRASSPLTSASFDSLLQTSPPSLSPKDLAALEVNFIPISKDQPTSPSVPRPTSPSWPLAPLPPPPCFHHGGLFPQHLEQGVYRNLSQKHHTRWKRIQDRKKTWTTRLQEYGLNTKIGCFCREWRTHVPGRHSRQHEEELVYSNTICSVYGRREVGGERDGVSSEISSPLPTCPRLALSAEQLKKQENDDMSMWTRCCLWVRAQFFPKARLLRFKFPENVERKAKRLHEKNLQRSMDWCRQQQRIVEEDAEQAPIRVEAMLPQILVGDGWSVSGGNSYSSSSGGGYGSVGAGCLTGMLRTSSSKAEVTATRELQTSPVRDTDVGDDDGDDGVILAAKSILLDATPMSMYFFVR